MEAFSGNISNCINFENKLTLKQSSIAMPMNNIDSTFVSDNFLSSFSNFSLISNEVNPPHASITRAILTINLSDLQILVVNSTACHLMRYSSDELCSMTLDNLVVDSQKYKVNKLCKEFTESLGDVPNTRGKLLELERKDGENLTVFMYLKKLDSPERCLGILEPIEKRTGVIHVDKNGNILSFDEGTPLIFHYEKSELMELNIFALLPAINFSDRNDDLEKTEIKQYITARGKKGEIFPVSLLISHPTVEEYKIIIWKYSNLNALILLNKEFKITNFNCYFNKLLLGYSKKKILHESILSIIPSFCKDYVKIEKVIDLNSSICSKNNGSHIDTDSSFNESSVNILENNFHITSNLSEDYEFSDSKLWPEPKKHKLLHNFSHENKNTNNDAKQFCEFDILPEKKSEHCSGRKIKHSDQNNDIVVCDSSCNENIIHVRKYLGCAQHSDGSYIDVKYQVKIADFSDEYYYYVWLSRDSLENLDSDKELNVQLVSKLTSMSVDSSFPKDSICSEQCTRPSTASLISQCDESLTAGDYSQYYTNIRQIGKGAFGYVKMAFRNSDGLLVVTKFIKKQNINVRSWVFYSNLHIKIPLEISLLAALNHPNIVKVLDVFHNEAFVQLVMEKHGAGFDLFEFINRRPNCDEKLKSYIFRQIISAVYYLNSLGILHRDIKDENVIINEKFEIKLIDFGSATFMPANETFSKFYGTVEYCSPEVLEGNSYKGPELEIWALGVTLYVLTFGENPFYNIEETIQGKFSIPFQISEELDDLLHRMLDKNVDTRITIDKVVEHYWINQPVFIENYRFEEVVKCSEEEAYPPKYIHEINSEDLAENSKTDNTLGGTNNSNDSFQETERSTQSNSFGRKGNLSSVLLSSTPLHYKNNRLCKSANSAANRLDNFSLLKDDDNKSYHSKCKVGFMSKNNYFKHPRSSTSSSENEFSDAGKSFKDIYLSDSEVNLKDGNFKVNDSLPSDELQSERFSVKFGGERFLEPENAVNTDR